MAKKKRTAPAPRTETADKPATLKDMLDPQVLAKLKATTDSLKASEAERLEKERQEREAARKAEQKRRDNDFEYLLEHSEMDWKKYK
ncbi:YqkE family protein [Paenibacillus sp. HGF5]|uniref:YqkE family protein n=1 Tax=Paenibacillus sp. HGF5 TaxID=908341 RepID=UPI0002071F91|nr:YqkE family protein [Paenibacillus sp. HGF5]EGG37310.1 conserved domain protein [Paenibacillus sp. HGF5]